MFKSYEGWILSTDATKTRKDEIDANGVWLHAGNHSLRSDVPTTLFFAAGTGDPSGASVSIGLSAFDGKSPVPVSGAAKSLSGLSSGQESLDVQFLPIGVIALTVSSLPANTTLKAKVAQ